jgi:DNA-binding CsgD family transcriptional regulator
VTLTPSHLELVGGIYDAVLEPAAWGNALERFSATLEARVANLLVYDRFHPEVQVTAAGPVWEPRLLETYQREYASSEADAAPRMLDRPAMTWVRTRELFESGYDQLPVAQWLERECGIHERVTARLNEHKAWFDVLTVNLPVGRGPFTREEEHLASLFLPHFARAVELSRPFAILRARFQAVLSVLDRFHVGVFILSQAGEVVVHNQEADRILRLDDGLTLGRLGQLSAHLASEASALRTALERATAVADQSEGTAQTVLTLTRPSGQDSLVAEVGPLRGAAAELGRQFRGAVLFVIDPTNHAVVSTRGMEELYQLTTAEAGILELLVKGHTTSELAEIRNISRETVRTQVKALLSKTSTKGRPDLVRLALTVNLPIDRPKQGDAL